MFCSRCGSENDLNSNYCRECGTHISEEKTSETTIDIQLNKNFDNIENFESIIGPKNTKYYLKNFIKFSKNRKASISWNWPAFFFGAIWFFYRKMFKNSIIIILILFFLRIFFSYLLLTNTITSFIYAISSLILTVLLQIISGLYANYIYYAHIKTIINGEYNYNKSQTGVSSKFKVFLFILIFGILGSFITISTEVITRTINEGEIIYENKIKDSVISSIEKESNFKVKNLDIYSLNNNKFGGTVEMDTGNEIIRKKIEILLDNNNFSWEILD